MRDGQCFVAVRAYGRVEYFAVEVVLHVGQPLVEPLFQFLAAAEGDFIGGRLESAQGVVARKVCVEEAEDTATCFPRLAFALQQLGDLAAGGRAGCGQERVAQIRDHGRGQPVVFFLEKSPEAVDDNQRGLASLAIDNAPGVHTGGNGVGCAHRDKGDRARNLVALGAEIRS